MASKIDRSSTKSAITDILAGTLMDWDAAVKLPWGVLLLLGGGLALAGAIDDSGLGAALALYSTRLQGVPPVLVVVFAIVLMTFLTELTSNTASTEMVLPILASVTVATNVHPLMLMIPATLSASCAFMMPVATPPNAIIFGSNRVRIPEMARIGLVLNLISVLVISLAFLLLGTAVFGIDFEVMPEWATFEGTGQ